MTGNTNLNFSSAELLEINAAIASAKDTIKNNCDQVKNCLEELQANVTGTQVNNLIATINDKLSTITGRMTGSFEQLDTFLTGQMRNYATTFESAASALKQALAFINENL